MKFSMKPLFGSILLTLATMTSPLAIADSTESTAELDKYSQLCLTALVSNQAFSAKARELEISKGERDRLVCNDLEIEEFASQFRLTETNTIATVQ